MVLFNAATKELTAKIVYYGPGLCGKTTNLQHIYDKLPGKARGKMLSPGHPDGPHPLLRFPAHRPRHHPGHEDPGPALHGARPGVLRRDPQTGAQAARTPWCSWRTPRRPLWTSNKESFQNLIENLKEQGTDLHLIPHVIQWNKRDTPNALPVATLNQEVNRFNAPTFEACAMKGEGVKETLAGVSKLVLKFLADKYGGGSIEAPAVLAPPPKAAKAAPPVVAAPPSRPMEVEEIGSSDALEEIEELEAEVAQGSVPAAARQTGAYRLPHSSVVEVPVVLDRSLFSGDAPVEIKLKLYIK